MDGLDLSHFVLSISAFQKRHYFISNYQFLIISSILKKLNILNFFKTASKVDKAQKKSEMQFKMFRSIRALNNIDQFKGRCNYKNLIN